MVYGQNVIVQTFNKLFPISLCIICVSCSPARVVSKVGEENPQIITLSIRFRAEDAEYLFIPEDSIQNHEVTITKSFEIIRVGRRSLLIREFIDINSFLDSTSIIQVPYSPDQ